MNMKKMNESTSVSVNQPEPKRINKKQQEGWDHVQLREHKEIEEKQNHEFDNKKNHSQF